MSDKDTKKEHEHEELQENTANAATEEELNQVDETAEQANAEAQQQDSTAVELAEMKDKFIRLMAEFENFRRRTAKERLELIKTAAEDVMTDLLPVLDDMDRASQSVGSAKDIEAVAQGLDLIFHKLKSVTIQKGLKPMETKAGDEFDSDFHEAVTQIPAPSEELKGKIVDVIEKGYTLNEKVIRFAKVVIGA
ncbi:nucleotide exchange factor GrpE [Pontibacter chinhatensis]|uniref:Protein GrpE n=1 Tax=Pontibacter chinhatensis TaxID=1436961 RepID=A0A1I2RQP1_9BACT|nr:nucleotide exchange factor GrpE [Pontibacter chinhatensis]SFG42770.1 molecular chaperone GrpE [Pontibacter chinhatensis]